jgi:hypothetical protein
MTTNYLKDLEKDLEEYRKDVEWDVTHGKSYIVDKNQEAYFNVQALKEGLALKEGYKKGCKDTEDKLLNEIGRILRNNLIQNGMTNIYSKIVLEIKELEGEKQ